MAYTIQYGLPARTEAVWAAGNRKRKRWIFTVLCIIGVLSGILFGPEDLQNYLIPGDPNVTRLAFAQLTEDIRQGDKIGEALTAFCREIIENAEVS